jgi:hypothetical protein
MFKSNQNKPDSMSNAKDLAQKSNESMNFLTGWKNKKIICKFWLLGDNGARDKLIGQKKTRVGKTQVYFRGSPYWLNYTQLKEDKKYFVLDIDVNNSVQALSFHKTTLEKVFPNQAELMLKDGQVKTFMGKGGIPAMYLLVAFIVVAIAMLGAVYLFSQYQVLSTQVEKQKGTIAQLQNEKNILQQQLDNIGAGFNG